MTRVMLILILWISVVEASAVVVVTQVQKRFYDLPGSPYGKKLDVDQNGATDFYFDFRTDYSADIFRSDGGTSLVIRSSAGTDPLTRTVAVEAGSLIGKQIFPTTGGATLWPIFDFGWSISSRTFSNLRPPISPDNFRHLGGSDNDGYLAFRLLSGGGTTYGYLHFQFVDWTKRVGGINEFAGNPMLVGWALENEPNAAIRVVPIPETRSIGLVAACGMVLSLRRRAVVRCLR